MHCSQYISGYISACRLSSSLSRRVNMNLSTDVHVFLISSWSPSGSLFRLSEHSTISSSTLEICNNSLLIAAMISSLFCSLSFSFPSRIAFMCAAFIASKALSCTLLLLVLTTSIGTRGAFPLVGLRAVCLVLPIWIVIKIRLKCFLP